MCGGGQRGRQLGLRLLPPDHGVVVDQTARDEVIDERHHTVIAWRAEDGHTSVRRMTAGRHILHSVHTFRLCKLGVDVKSDIRKTKNRQHDM